MQAELTFQRSHQFPPQELLARIVSLATEMVDEYHLETSWSDDYKSLKFESTGGMSKGLTGTLQIEPDRVQMVLHLPFALRPMASTIRDEVEQYLDRNVGAQDGRQKS